MSEREERLWSMKDKLYPWNTGIVADIARIQSHRNKIHQIYDTKKWLSKEDFETMWSDISATLLNLARAFGIPNMFFEIEKVLHEPLDQQKQDQLMKILDEIKTQHTGLVKAVEAWEHSPNAFKEHNNLKECSEREMALRYDSIPDDVFVKTKAYENASQCLTERRICVLRGNHGEGKSTIAFKLISIYSQKGYRILKTHEDWRSVHFQSCDVILIDDIFGVAVLDQHNLKQWYPFLGEIQQAIKEEAAFVIITIKPHIFEQAITCLFTKLRGLFDDENIVNVKSEDISKDERSNILKNHLEKNGHNSNDIESLTSMIEKNAFSCTTMFQIGFPQCVKMYAEIPTLFEKGFEFFKKPIDYVKQCLLDMFQEQTIFSAFLFLWSQPSQAVRITELENEEKHISCLLKACNISSNDVKNTLLHHKDGFINYYTDIMEISFSHDVIAVVVGLIVFERDFKNGIELCSLNFIMDYVTTEETDEVLYKVLIKKPRFGQLLKRLLSLYRLNDSSVLTHNAFKNDLFLFELRKREEKHEILEIFYCACCNGYIDLVTRFLDFELNYKEHVVEGFSPIHSAAYFGQSETVKKLVNNDVEQLKLMISNAGEKWSKYEGATLLHIAVLKKFDVLINELKMLGADDKIKDSEGNTPLLLSIKEDRNKISRILIGWRDPPINTPDNKSITPLMEATRKEKYKILKTLINCSNVDVNCKNIEGKTALDIAIQTGNEKIQNLLKMAGAKTAAELLA